MHKVLLVGDKVTPMAEALRLYPELLQKGQVYTVDYVSPMRIGLMEVVGYLFLHERFKKAKKEAQ